jgi:predicted MFS family arabinose efflux permease
VFFVLGAARVVVTALVIREAGRVPEPRKAGVLPVRSLLAVPAAGALLFAGMLGAWAPFANVALLAVGAALLLYALVTQYGHLLRRSGAPAILGGVFTEGLFVFGGLAYMASSLTDRFAISFSAAGLLLAGFGLGGLIYSASVKGLLARIGDLGILVLGGVLLGVGFVGIGTIPTWQLFVPLVIVLGMGYYTMHGTLQTRATEMAPEARGTAIALFAFAFFMGQSTGPIVLGRILQARGYVAVFVTAGVGLLALSLTARAAFIRARANVRAA